MEKQKKSRKSLLVGVIAAVVVLAALLALLLTQCVGGQGPADSTGQTETTVPQSAAAYELYWNVDRLNYQVGESVGTTGREPHEDGYYHMIFAKDGELLELRVVDRRLANRIDGLELMGLVFDENGIVVDLIRLEDMPLEKLVWSFYVQSIATTAVKFNSSASFDGMEETIRINENTKILDVSGWSDYVGAPASLQKGDRAYVIANEDGDVTHIFLYERDGILHTEVRYCEHCKEDKEFISWLKKDELPVSTDHYFLENDVTVVKQQAIREGQEICLDLNGKTVIGNGNQRIYSTFNVNSKLAVMDSSEEKTGTMKTLGKNMDQGGVLWCRYGTIDVYGGTYDASESTTKTGGNVFAVEKPGVFTMHDGLVIGGTSKGDGANLGGNIRIAGRFILNGGTITKGTAVNSNGGNIAVISAEAVLQINGGTISNGIVQKGKGGANGIGGNIYCSGSVDMNGGTVTGGRVLDENGKNMPEQPSRNMVLVNGTLRMYGGRIGGYIHTIDTSATDKRTLTIHLGGWANIHGAEEGHPNLRITDRVKVYVSTLSGSAKIGITSAHPYFSEKTQASNAKYFFSDLKGADVVHHDGRLAVGKLACMCFAKEGEEHDASICDGTDQLWGAWNGSNAIAVSGNYYLPSDVTVTNTQAVIGKNTTKDANGNEIKADPIVVNIDLNGKTATYPKTRGMLIFGNATVNLYNSQGGGSYSGAGYLQEKDSNCGTIMTFRESTLNIYDGVVLAGIEENNLICTGVLQAAGTVNMYGGEIVGTRVRDFGGAVRVGSAGTFNMYNDAKITGGYTTGDGTNGGAVHMDPGAVFTMTDNAVVSGGQARNAGGNFYINGTLIMSGNAKITGGTQRGANGEAILERRGNIFAVNSKVIMSGNSSIDGYCNLTATKEGKTAELHVSENAKITGADPSVSNVTLSYWDGGLAMIVLDAPLGDDACIRVTPKTTKIVSRPEGMSDEDWAAFKDSADNFLSEDGLLEGVWQNDGIYLSGVRTDAEPIEHCLCGANEGEEHIGGCTGEVLTWTAWPVPDALPQAGGNYYLTDNVQLKAAWNPKSESAITINLDLNGKTVCSPDFDRVLALTDANVTLNITDASEGHVGVITHHAERLNAGSAHATLAWVRGSSTMNTYRVTMDAEKVTANFGVAIVVGNSGMDKGTLNMYATTVKGGTAAYNQSANGGGAISIRGGSTVYAEDSTISAVYGIHGGAIYIKENANLTLKDSVVKDAKGYHGTAIAIFNATVTLDGAEIYGGKGTEDRGAVTLNENANLILAGATKIHGNTPCDLYLAHNAANPITIAESWTGNGETPMVVVMNKGTGKFAAAAEGFALTDAHKAYFSNPAGYQIQLSATGLYLAEALPETDPTTHCLCGAIEGEEHMGDCDGTVLTWTEWTATDSLPTEAGNYYLADHVELAACYKPASDSAIVINLDLNGKTVYGPEGDRPMTISDPDVTLNITDSSAGHRGTITHHANRLNTQQGALVFVIGSAELNLYRVTLDAENVSGTFGVAMMVGDGSLGNGFVNMYGVTVKGGTATHNANTSGGGAIAIRKGSALYAEGCTISAVKGNYGGTIYIKENSTLTLKDTKIQGAAANFGSALAIYDSTVTMDGGEIFGGTGTQGGVVLNGSASLTLNGTAKIYGNDSCDVYLTAGTFLTIGETWAGNGGEMMVVTMADGMGTFAKAAEGFTLTDAHKDYFDSADGYEVDLGADGLCFVEPTITVDPSSHCLCGAIEGEEHMGDCDGTVLTWTEWTATDSLPTEAGNYYLAENVQLTACYKPTSDSAIVINLDLNGKTVYGPEGDRPMTISDPDVTLNITDSSPRHKGIITHHANRLNTQQGALVFVIGSAKLNLYRVVLDAENVSGTFGVAMMVGDGSLGNGFVNMYGVTVKGGTATHNANTSGGGAIAIRKGSALYAEGCTISAVKGNYGGTIYIKENSTLTLKDTKIQGAAANFGSALAIYDSTVTMDGGEIFGGTGTQGGVTLFGTGKLTLSGDAKIHNNESCDVNLAAGAAITVGENWTANGDKAMNITTAATLAENSILFAKGAEDEAWDASVAAIKAAIDSGSIKFNGTAVEDGVLNGLAVYYNSVDGVKLIQPVDPASHCLCGAINGEPHIGACDGTVLTWTKWTATDSLPTEAGNYYLDGDVQLTATFSPASDSAIVINLDLNGKTVYSPNNGRTMGLGNANVTLNITDSSVGNTGVITHHADRTSTDQAALIWASRSALNLYRVTLDAEKVTGTFGVALYVGNSGVATTVNMYDTTIKGGKATHNTTASGGGAIAVRGGSSLYAEDCTITSNYSLYGGAIFVKESSTLTLKNTTVKGSGYVGAALMADNSTVVMDGGEITGSNGERGAVAIANSATMTLKGDAKIYGNANCDVLLWTTTTTSPLLFADGWNNNGGNAMVVNGTANINATLFTRPAGMSDEDWNAYKDIFVSTANGPRYVNFTETGIYLGDAAAN